MVFAFFFLRCRNMVVVVAKVVMAKVVPLKVVPLKVILVKLAKVIRLFVCHLAVIE